MYAFGVIKQAGKNIQARAPCCVPSTSSSSLQFFLLLFCIRVSEPKSHRKICTSKHSAYETGFLEYIFAHFTALNLQLVCFVSLCHTSLVTYNKTRESSCEMQRKQLPACPIKRTNMSWEKYGPAEAFRPPVQGRFLSIFIVRYHQSIFPPFYL